MPEGSDAGGRPAAPHPSGPAELRWALVLYGTAAFVPACLLLAVLTAGGRQAGRLFVDYLAAPFPIPIAIAYGAGYLLVQHRVRDPRPSFLQSQVFAGCVFVGMFAAFAACSVVVAHTPLRDASRTTVTAVLVPVKVVLGGLAGAYLYPLLANRRLAGRHPSPMPIPPGSARPRAAGEGEPAAAAGAGPDAGAAPAAGTGPAAGARRGAAGGGHAGARRRR